MAQLLSFDGLKQAGIANARRYRICENLHAYMRTQNYQDLVLAAIPDLVYLYRSGIVTNELLAEVDEALLNYCGIYTTDAVIENPETEIFALNEAQLTLTLNNGGRHTINVMGIAQVALTIENNTFCKIFCYGDTFVNPTVNDTSAICLELRQNSTATLVLNDTAVADIVTKGDSTLNLTSNNGSYALIQGFSHSLITALGTGTIEQRLYELSKNTGVLI